MRLKIAFKIALVLAALATAGAAFQNCSQKASHSNGSGGAQLTPSPAPLPEDYETADMAGHINAYQDLQFRFKIPGASAGASYVGVNLPPWLSVDVANGELSGVPDDIRTFTDIRVNIIRGGATAVAGPYTIKVTGDPLKRMQWHLRNLGVPVFSANNPTAGEDIKMTESVRARVLGKDIKIAVSDSGVQEDHPGLAPNLMPELSRNYLNNFQVTGSWLGNSSPADSAPPEDAHGTSVAGIIAERGWTGLGGRGVAPLAKLAGFLFIPAIDQLVLNGLYSVATLDQFTGAFDIFNYSWGDVQCALTEYPQSYKDKIKAGTSLRGGKGAIYVKAAGNEFITASADCYDGVADSVWALGNANFSEDGVSPYLINVAALNAAGKAASYSTPGSNIWISAPGGEFGWDTGVSGDPAELDPAIVTTDFTGCDKGIKTFSDGRNDFDDGAAPNTACRHTATMNGTSSATPVVSGAAALLLSVNPNLSWRDVRHILAVTADQIDPTAGNTRHPAGSGYNPTGHVYQRGWVSNAAGFKFHNWYGFGRVNVDRAVSMARSYVSGFGAFKETNSGPAYKYSSGNLALSVAGGSIAGQERTINVTDNLKIESVVVRVNITGCAGAIGLELTSPAGTKSILMNIYSQLLDTDIANHEFLTNAFYQENSAGTWRLKVINPRSGCSATWNSWQINILGH